MERDAKLIPQYMQVLFKDNRLSIKFNIQDNLTLGIVGDAFVNFTPSEKLMNLLREETNKALKEKQS